MMVLLIVLTGCSGCIKVAQDSLSGEPSFTLENSPDVTDIPTLAENITVQTTIPTPTPAPELTPVKSDIVKDATPCTTPNPYPILHGVRINSTPQYAFLYRAPEYTKTYTLTGNAYGLVVNVVEGPLYIRYTVNPKYDCLDDPDSCRGTVFAPVNRPYMTITVRDNQTQQIVAKDGYGREYSSDKGDYSAGSSSGSSSVSSSYDNSDKGNYAHEPSPRYIPVYKEGQFHITIEGNYLDVTVAVITGTAAPLEKNPENPAGGIPASGSPDWND
ncbi:MAG TPA: hypothetical protein PKM50_01340 [Methanoregula sp.]|nr:hypothetical protein [Methanoregula sp.]